MLFSANTKLILSAALVFFVSALAFPAKDAIIPATGFHTLSNRGVSLRCAALSPYSKHKMEVSL